MVDLNLSKDIDSTLKACLEVNELYIIYKKSLRLIFKFVILKHNMSI